MNVCERCNRCIFEFTSGSKCAGQQHRMKKVLSCPSVCLSASNRFARLRSRFMGVRYARDSAGRRWNSSLSKCTEGDTVEVMVNGCFV